MTEVTYFKFNQSFERKYFDPQNYDLLQDNISKIINEQMGEFENTIKDFLRSRGYNISENAGKEEYTKILEQLKSEDKFIDYLTDIDTREIADGFRCTYTYIPFFNKISSPIDERTREILLENWRNLYKKEK